MRLLRAVRWYLRELVGEGAYDRYAQRHRACPTGTPLLSRREFERARQRDHRPGARCC